jgi:hypothetical protein
MTSNRKGSVISAGAAVVFATLAVSAAFGAQSLYVRDEGRLHYTSRTGSILHEEGEATGSLPGKLSVQFAYTGTSLTVNAQFTLTGHGWSLTGRGTGTLSNPNSSSPSFRGPLTITAGSGRYAHAHARGELFGVFYRRKHYALTVQTLGDLTY